MSEPISRLLDLFDALPEPDKQSAVDALIRRKPLGESDLPEADLDALAGELFAALDAEEDARGAGRCSTTA